ncbi:MAG: glycosyltransferase family 2 protein [Erysipelotrichia bacterium]|nr:glycosyltransferase family 2 protein [Erysipelotrichia bacterium]
MKWYEKYLEVYEKKLSEISPEIIKKISTNLCNIQSTSPIATISIIAYNEEKHLIACLWSLSEMQCQYPIEVIGVDNDSTDCTAEIFEKCGVPFYTEKKHSCGYARLCGLTHARGKYHINIDSDTMYPPKYVELMINVLKQPGVIGVSSLWSYIPDKKHSKLALNLYELIRDLYLFLQSFKRPELSVRGLVFGYHTQYAQKVGIRTDIIRGEDGYLALQLKKYGKIAFLYNRQARAITGYGTVGVDGSLRNSFRIRAIKATKNIFNLFTQKSNYEDEESNLIEKKKND